MKVEGVHGLACDRCGQLTTRAGPQPGSAQTAVICGDVATRRGIDTYWHAVRGGRVPHPSAAPLTNNISPGEFWPPQAEPPMVLDNNAVPALL